MQSDYRARMKSCRKQEKENDLLRPSAKWKLQAGRGLSTDTLLYSSTPQLFTAFPRGDAGNPAETGIRHVRSS